MMKRSEKLEKELRKVLAEEALELQAETEAKLALAFEDLNTADYVRLGEEFVMIDTVFLNSDYIEVYVKEGYYLKNNEKSYLAWPADHRVYIRFKHLDDYEIITQKQFEKARTTYQSVQKLFKQL